MFFFQLALTGKFVLPVLGNHDVHEKNQVRLKDLLKDHFMKTENLFTISVGCVTTLPFKEIMKTSQPTNELTNQPTDGHMRVHRSYTSNKLLSPVHKFTPVLF